MVIMNFFVVYGWTDIIYHVQYILDYYIWELLITLQIDFACL